MTDETPDFRAMAEWAADLYEERTRLLAENKLPICHVHPAYRVTIHEIMRQFDLNLAPWMKEFQMQWQLVTRRRGLRPVINGQVKAAEWVASHPPRPRTNGGTDERQ